MLIVDWFIVVVFFLMWCLPSLIIVMKIALLTGMQ